MATDLAVGIFWLWGVIAFIMYCADTLAVGLFEPESVGGDHV